MTGSLGLIRIHNNTADQDIVEAREAPVHGFPMSSRQSSMPREYWERLFDGFFPASNSPGSSPGSKGSAHNTHRKVLVALKITLKSREFMGLAYLFNRPEQLLRVY